jgi:hypothetical protein
VTAKVVGHVLGEKIRIGKRRPKSGYRRQTGFRARLSQIEIEAIGGSRRTTTERKEAPAPAPAPEEKQAAEAPDQLPRGYSDFTIADITDKSKRWNVKQLETALEFERANANRKGALAVLETALAAKQEKEG